MCLPLHLQLKARLQDQAPPLDVPQAAILLNYRRGRADAHVQPQGSRHSMCHGCRLLALQAFSSRHEKTTGRYPVTAGLLRLTQMLLKARVRHPVIPVSPATIPQQKFRGCLLLSCCSRVLRLTLKCCSPYGSSQKCACVYRHLCKKSLRSQIWSSACHPRELHGLHQEDT